MSFGSSAELEVFTVEIWTDLSAVEVRLQSIVCDCENSVNSMRREEASFSECSSFLQSWDDKLTMLRSKLVQNLKYSQLKFGLSRSSPNMYMSHLICTVTISRDYLEALLTLPV